MKVILKIVVSIIFQVPPQGHPLVIKVFLDLLERIKKHLFKHKQDLSAGYFTSVENLFGMDPNWLLYNLVLTPAVYTQRSPQEERLYC